MASTLSMILAAGVGVALLVWAVGSLSGGNGSTGDDSGTDPASAETDESDSGGGGGGGDGGGGGGGGDGGGGDGDGGGGGD